MPAQVTAGSGLSKRTLLVRGGVRIEVVTVAWMVVEAAVSLGAGIVAGSLLLVAFGLDSVIELVSGSILLWRLSTEARGGDVKRVEQAERRATRVVAVTLVILCVYVLASAVYGLLARAKPESSLVGIAVAAAAVVVMPYLGVTKRRLASRLESAALRGDAAESFTCAYMAATVLAGLALNAVFGWWWAEDVAALVFLFWLVGETREAFEEAREGAQEEGEAEEAEEA
jgi:divalent metal cation (Fe/Co/Zn/Cd) transporter